MKYHKTQQKHYEINRTFENKKKTPQKHDKYRKMIENTHKTPGKTPQKNHENQRSDKDWHSINVKIGEIRASRKKTSQRRERGGAK